MTYIRYEHFNFTSKTQDVIENAEQILQEYKADGYTLTLRQLYYQFVARDLLPNSDASYNRLGEIITRARLAGEISWTSIEDRGRGINAWQIDEDEQSVLSGIEYGLALDFWERQDKYVEVWVEKEALASVIERPASNWRVPYMSCKGYLSASEAWRAGRRFRKARHEGRECTIIHLGDHDPSGIDMTRDVTRRIEQFAEGSVDVRRIALNMPQIEQFDPPPNPTKLSDSRAGDYIEKFGYTSWELDALPPREIGRLIENEISSLVDADVWQETQDEEDERRERLGKLERHWSTVGEFIDGLD